VVREREQASGQQVQTAISLGATVLSALLGRKRLSYGTLGRATTTLRGAGRTAKEQGDVRRAATEVETIRGQIADLEREIESELDQIEHRLDPQTEELTTTALRPRRGDVSVRLVALAWCPGETT
jgi:hypothetical protein